MFTTKKIFHYLLVFSVLLTACKKEEEDDDDDDTTPTVIDINSNYQFRGTVDGVDYSFVVGGNATYGMGVSLDGGTFDNVTGEGESFLSSFIGTQQNEDLIRIQNRTLRYTDYATVAEMEDFIHVGSHSYSVEPNDGITIFWKDNNGVYWTTDQGTANQSGSSFNIIAIQALNTLGSKQYKVYAKFKCKLYNNSGASLQLTDGEYVGYFDSLDW